MCTSSSQTINSADCPPAVDKKAIIMGILWKCLRNCLLFFHIALDYVVDLCFGFYYDASKRKAVPPVKEKFLLESATSLAKKIRTKELTSVQVVEAFINRIKEINPILNCVVDERFEAALQDAQEADDLLASGKISASELEKKPFFGIPFTTKDSTCVKGLRQTLGLVARQHYRANEDADVVTLMKKAGAIIIAVTNIPELAMWYETRNSIHGTTLNPYDTTRMVGGSSGGEACVLTACGSPIGIGTDIGGSIRMPAFFCGIFGHKPTTGLTPLKGLTRRTGLEGHTMVAAGPMAKHAEDLGPCLRVICGENASKLELEKKGLPEDFHCYFMEEDGGDLKVSRLSEDLKIAMHHAVNHFRENKYPVQKLHLSGMKYGYRLWRYWMTKEPEKFAEELANREGRASIWTELPKKIMGKSNYTLSSILRLLDDHLPQEDPIWAEKTTKDLLKQLVETLGENGVFLYPSHPFPPIHHYSAFFRPYNFSYTAVINTLNLPVTQVPLGLNKDGLPVGIQVVAGPFKDHLSIAVAEELQRKFGGWVPPFAA